MKIVEVLHDQGDLEIFLSLKQDPLFGSSRGEYLFLRCPRLHLYPHQSNHVSTISHPCHLSPGYVGIYFPEFLG